ncbi:Imm1 family immunity protein (plasmid) [Streptomyces sp. NBC_01166]|uniref:Imm1 family immunity protein n=1 Tax=Streptomyces sp. NBC_01166 TaxID=2903755 RepID=UPI002F91B811|nr:Imm1 family immunity protein [Streptomyces sp. NBC_01166]WST35312.1 Imm1 family immunity protein [Streptomyces sp. NBC_01166]
MALKVFNDEPLYLETQNELNEYLDKIFVEDRHLNAEKVATFQVVDISAGKTDTPDNVLAIGIDYLSGYGGILWYCDGAIFDRVAETLGEDVADNVWVSRNPNPLENDPQVVCDPWCPSYFDRVSALPLDEVRSVVEGFFHEGTGYRPTQIDWVKGYFTGELQIEDGQSQGS